MKTEKHLHENHDPNDGRDAQALADRLDLAAETAGFGTWEWDEAGKEFYWDRHMHSLYEVRPGEMGDLFKVWRDRIHPADASDAQQAMDRALAGAHGQGPVEWTFRIIRSDGTVRHILARCMAGAGEGGASGKVAGVHLDITRQTLALQELRVMATTDPLTGLLNRSHFMETTRRELERCIRYPKPFSLVLFDVDGLRKINTAHGNETGDAVLAQLARIASEGLREVDVLGRTGGEEFCLAMPETDEDSANSAAERLLETVQAGPLPIPGKDPVDVAISCGVSSCVDAVEHVDTLLWWADMAMRQAKAKGGGRVVVYRHIETVEDA